MVVIEEYRKDGTRADRRRIPLIIASLVLAAIGIIIGTLAIYYNVSQYSGVILLAVMVLAIFSGACLLAACSESK